MHAGVPRVQAKRLLVLQDRGLHLPLLRQGAAKVGVRDGVVRAEPDDFPILRDRHLQPALLLVRHPQVRFGGQEGGVQLHRLTVLLDGQFVPPRSFVDLAEKKVGVGRAGLQLDRLFVPVHRLLGPAGLREEETRHEVDIGVIGVRLQQRLGPGPDCLDVVRLLEGTGVGLPGLAGLSPDEVDDIHRKVRPRVLA